MYATLWMASYTRTQRRPQVCLPVYFNEPLSALQKMAEELEYSELLDKARSQSNAWCHLIYNLAAAHVSSHCYSAVGCR